MQTNPHCVPSHVAVAFAGGWHGVHELPQLAGLLFETQAVPHRWKPELHTEPHLVPSQVAVEFAGGTHGVHDVVPHELGLLLGWQVPEQSCDPAGHTPLHEAVEGMQLPAQTLVFAGQETPHIEPSQVAVPPPVGVGQGVHDDVPQLAVLVLETQLEPQG